MSVENELKYVLDPTCEPVVREALKDLGDPKLLQQGYLNSQTRLRRDQWNSFFTYKHMVGEKLYEIETKIGRETFDALWPETNERLSKRRYSTSGPIDNWRYAAKGEVVWDIDFFLREDGSVYFAMAECEMPDGMETPDEILPLIAPYVVYAVPRHASHRYTSRRLSDDVAASLILAHIKQSDEAR